VGSFLSESLNRLDKDFVVRGEGLMTGIEFSVPVKEIRSRLLNEFHIFTGFSGTNTIRLLPPLCLTMEQAEQFLDAFSKIKRLL
jgi:acetylornithine aminotransferase